MWAATTFSAILMMLAPAPLVVPAPQGEFRFSGVQVWRYSAPRGERIPAFSGELDNQTGRDWSDATFRINAVCADGKRTYDIRLKDVGAGRQNVNQTVYDSIGAVQACDERDVSIEFVGGTPGSQPAYVVLGFAQEFKDSGWTTALEGIIDHRRPTQFRSTTHAVYWRDGGEKLFEVGGPDPVAFYSFRVDPGEFGLAGFTLSRDPQDTGVLSRFLRLYMLEAGTATYFGVFRVFNGRGSEAGVRIEFDERAYERLAAGRVNQLPVVKGKPYQPLVQGSVTLAK